MTLQGEGGHRLVFTVAPGSNGRRFRVRCQCMSQVSGEKGYREIQFYTYDYLAEVSGPDAIAQAVRVWEQHVAQTGQVAVWIDGIGRKTA